MMLFRTVKNSIIENVLGPAETGSFQTIGFQRQVKNASEVLGVNRFVQVYFKSGGFSKSGGSISGPVLHDITFQIDLTLSTGAQGDLAVITDPNSTAPQVANAISLSQESSQLADESFDELVDKVYQILMDARNYDLGLTAGTVANRWINQINKNQPEPRGEYVTLTGSMLLTCRVSEAVDGDPGVTGNKIHETTIDIIDDDVEKTGVTVQEV